jgi:DNA invertase Pin-like site-specific DNA recombinase
MRAKLIARVSTESQDANIRMQELREFAVSNNYKICAEYWINESATVDIDNRTDFMKALQDDKGEDIIIINKLDRLTRNFKSISWFEEFIENNINIISIDHQTNLKTATGRLVFRQLLLIACFETEQTKERMKAKVEQMKAQGKYKGRQKGAKGKVKDSKNVGIDKINASDKYLKTQKNVSNAFTEGKKAINRLKRRI